MRKFINKIIFSEFIYNFIVSLFLFLIMLIVVLIGYCSVLFTVWTCTIIGVHWSIGFICWWIAIFILCLLVLEKKADAGINWNSKIVLSDFTAIQATTNIKIKPNKRKLGAT